MVRKPQRVLPSPTHAFVLLCCVALACALSGCTAPRWATSRWAMDQPEYASKYEHPYTEEGRDKIHRLGKQMVDARYIGGRSGWHLGGVYQGESPASAGGTIGRFSFSDNGLIERHFGFSGVGGTSIQEGFLGMNGGVRLQSPSRLAPFAGVGGFAGVNWKDVAVVSAAAIIDVITADEDDDDTLGEALIRTRRGKTHGFAAIYPELGVHYWLNSRTRVTASGSYWISTQGRAQDSWFLGINLGFLFGSEIVHPETSPEEEIYWDSAEQRAARSMRRPTFSEEETAALLGLDRFNIVARPPDVPSTTGTPTATNAPSPWLGQRPTSPLFDLEYSPPPSIPPVRERVQ